MPNLKADKSPPQTHDAGDHSELLGQRSQHSKSPWPLNLTYGVREGSGWMLHIAEISPPATSPAGGTVFTTLNKGGLPFPRETPLNAI